MASDVHSACPSMKMLAVAVTLFALSSIPAAADTYSIDAARSRIAFSVRHLLGTARGEFRNFSGTIEVDPHQPERSSVTVRIQVPSIDTQIRKRDEHLLSADFFDAKKFPEILFRSRSVRRTALNQGEITGDLTMHGVTRPLTLSVKHVTSITGERMWPARTRWVVSCKPIRRKDFDLMFGRAAEAISGIGQEVVPQIEIEAARSD